MFQELKTSFGVELSQHDRPEHVELQPNCSGRVAARTGLRDRRHGVFHLPVCPYGDWAELGCCTPPLTAVKLGDVLSRNLEKHRYFL